MKFKKLLPLLALASGTTIFAGPIVFYANLDGPSEFPPVASPSIGLAFVTIDDVAHSMRVQVSFSGLVGTTTNAHIHLSSTPGLGTGGVATTTPTFTGFPVGVTSGSYDSLYDMTLAGSYNPTFITNNGGTPASAEAALFAGIAQGRAYLNIHSSFAAGGEIRGFLQPVPEPATLGLSALALAALVLRRKR